VCATVVRAVTAAPERDAHTRAVAESAARQTCRPVAHAADKIEYARPLKAQGWPESIASERVTDVDKLRPFRSSLRM
jgi:hypothetical protein